MELAPSLAAGLLLIGAYVVLVVAVVHVLASRRHHRAIALVLGLIPIGAAIARAVPETTVGGLEVGASATPFVAFVCATVLAYVLRGRQVTGDHLFGAAACFMLLAHAWAGLYAIVELTTSRDSFTVPTSELAMDDLLYFSSVTITTLGYGDIAPVTKPARALATLEAMAGMFYLAVIVSRLVGRFRLED